MRPRVEVELWSGLRAQAGGAAKVWAEGRNLGEILDDLARRFPAMAQVLEDGVSVAVNGQIAATARDVKVKEGDEIVLLQRIRGG